MTLYEAKCEQCGIVEISKPMEAPFPAVCNVCGHPIERLFGTHRVIYNAPGFDGYDDQFKRHCTPEAYARFEKQKEAILTREAMYGK